jgi:heme exporter protein A
MRLSGRGVTCVRGGRPVFAGLDFATSSGEVLAVTGPNGSGKTSLLRLIAGLLQPAEGSIALDGGEDELTLAEQAHYQGHRDALKPALSVMENLAFWRDFLGGETADAGESLAAVALPGRCSPVWDRARQTGPGCEPLPSARRRGFEPVSASWW